MLPSNCIGINDEEEPKEFIWASCPDKTESVDVIGESISTRLWKEKYEVIDVLRETVSCDDADCDDEQHQRHHSLMKDPPFYIKIAERKHLFGGHFFSVKDEENIYEKLLEDLKERDLQYPATGLRIETIKGLSETSGLCKRFSSFNIFASKYILHVIGKEVMAMALCVKKWFLYDRDNKVFQETKVDFHETLRKLRKMIWKHFSSQLCYMYPSMVQRNCTS